MLVPEATAVSAGHAGSFRISKLLKTTNVNFVTRHLPHSLHKNVSNFFSNKPNGQSRSLDLKLGKPAYSIAIFVFG